MWNSSDANEKFFLLLQLAVGKDVDYDFDFTEEDWNYIYDIACKQSLVGVVISSVDLLSSQGQKPPFDLLLQWIGESELIRQQNKQVDQQCEQLTAWFRNAGISSCVIKGQGVARLYPHPDLRQSGDIDIWVDAKRDEVVNRMRSEYLNVTYVDYVNCHSAFFCDTEVEVHFRPTWMFNPFVNRKAQKWIRLNKKSQMANFDEKVGFSYPTIGFNLVFSLIHIYRHVFFEGIGLRQLMDYYFILTHSTSGERVEAFKTLKSFGLGKFAAAIMHIMSHVFDIDRELQICEPNSAEGEFLLSEIMRGGNFGQYDDRIKHMSIEHRWRRGIENLKRNMMFLRHYPNEVVWIPAWKVWHYGWRAWKGYL